jgi:hypothetical protein
MRYAPGPSVPTARHSLRAEEAGRLREMSRLQRGGAAPSLDMAALERRFGKEGKIHVHNDVVRPKRLATPGLFLHH